MSSNPSRRSFLQQSTLASLGVLVAGKSAFATNLFQTKPNSLINGVQIGVTTYSYRAMPDSGDVLRILQYCVDSNINAVELKGDAVEDYAGKPVNTVKLPPRVAGQPQVLSDEIKSQQKAYKDQVAAWRESVPMDKFIELGKKFKAAGLNIYAYKPNGLEKDNTDGEIEYALRAGKALGAKCVTMELPADPEQTKRMGRLGEKNNMQIGYHSHLQSTNTVWDVALSQSKFNTMNIDCGHYIAAGNTKEDLLALIEARHDRISSMHLKDRMSKANGGKNRVWGEGDTPLKEILALMKEKKYKFPATIELEYDIPASSDPVKETKRCLEYARTLLGG